MELNLKSLQVFGRDENGAVADRLGDMYAAIVGPWPGPPLIIRLLLSAKARCRKPPIARPSLERVGRSTSAEVEAKAIAFFLGNDPLQVTPTVSVNAETVTVSATYSQPTFLLHAVGTAQTTVSARAVARRGTSKPPCVLTFN